MADLNGHEGGNAGNGQAKPAGASGSPRPTAERVEERRQAKGNADRKTRPGPGAGEGVRSARDRIRRAAKTDKGRRFTALLHHVYNTDTLREAYFGLKHDAAPGIDGVTWHAYGEQLENNLTDLSARLKRGAYRAKAVRRVLIPKPD